MRIELFILLIISGVANSAVAQFGFLAPHIARDTGYIKNYDSNIVGRFFVQQKFLNFGIPGRSSAEAFKYRTNSKLSLGAGFTYRVLNLNIAVGLPYLTQNAKDKGKTRSLDLQMHILGRRMMYDIYGLFYKGFHIRTQNFVPGFEKYYYRDDIKFRLIGGTVYYVLNPKKYSFRMGLINDEWQFRSGGTFVASFDAFFGTVFTDSTRFIIPDTLAANYGNGNIERFRTLTFGPGVGYAYNLVFLKHWFVSATATISGNIAFTRERIDTGHLDQVRLAPNLSYMAAVGYNSDRWIVAASVINSGIIFRGELSDGNYSVNSGFARLTLAYRFDQGRRVQQGTRFIDKRLENDIFEKLFKKKDHHDIPEKDKAEPNDGSAG